MTEHEVEPLRIRSKGHKGRASRQSVTAGLNLFPPHRVRDMGGLRHPLLNPCILPHVDVEAKPCIGQGWLIRSRLHLSSPSSRSLASLRSASLQGTFGPRSLIICRWKPRLMRICDRKKKTANSYVAGNRGRSCQSRMVGHLYYGFVFCSSQDYHQGQRTVPARPEDEALY